MKENYERILVTKLSPSTHEHLKELAKEDRRTLSAMSRIIIEDYVEGSSIDHLRSQE
jgi:predicted DNA-binding protein